MRHWLAAAALALALGACDSLLVEEPRSFLTTDSFYRNAADAENGVQSVYGSIFSALIMTNGNTFAGLGLVSDQEQVRLGAQGQGPVTMSYMEWTASAPQFTQNAWQNFYQAIYRANMILDRLPGISMTESARQSLEAEARFLRAFSYLMLDKLYSSGPDLLTALSVPLLRSEADHLAADQKPRASVQEMHAFILEELTAAEAVLPAQRPLSQRGRATKGMAQAALMDLYLWRSSYHTTNEWQKVAEWSKKIIDSGQYDLVRTGFFNIFNPHTKADNREIIFPLVASGNPGRQNSGVVNLYAPNDLGQNTGGGFGTNVPTRWMIESFVPGDIRGTMGQTHAPGMFATDTFAYRDYGCSTSAAVGCRQLREPHVYKYRATSLQAALGDVDGSVYRYAEVLLAYAEAQAHLGNPQTAVQYVNMVRERARGGATGTQNRAEPADLPSNLSGQALIDAIFMERHWELAHEGKRHFDLVRRNSMEPGYWVSELTAHAPHATARTDLANSEHLMRWPIPGREMDLLPLLVQNPGY